MTPAIFRAFAVFLLLAVSPGQAIGQTIGTVVRVVPGATLERAGQAFGLTAGQGVASGDVISTDRRGQVQLLFADETRMAIGPNSSLAIDDIRLRKNGTARKFAVSAVAGGFRFLSGTSARSAYAITTPTATLGIRGTAFDFVVRNTTGTDLVLFSGQVRMCAASGGCFQVAGECSAVRMDRAGAFSQFSKRKEKRELIFDGFGFVTGQTRLAPAFRTNVRSCGRDVMARPVAKAGNREPPEPPEPPEAPGGF